LRNKIVDLQARSMRDNLLFFNIPERDQGNTTEIIQELLEAKMGIHDARTKVKIGPIGLGENENETKNRVRSLSSLTIIKTESTCG
jgi:hypothetical protein